ncbi:MAG: ATP-binding cassette domain-containing protein [Myxococcota bacterium]|nr:ATP-binding cassette domain-containing protein [Myxococcota bacterium]
MFEAKDLSCVLGQGKKKTIAVRQLTFVVNEGETTAVVGESGSGKTTLARMLLGLQAKTSGTLLFRGHPIVGNINHYREVQAVFQDPYTAFNQFYTVDRQLMDAFKLFKASKPKELQRQTTAKAMKLVGLDPELVVGKYPFQFSGGQLQQLLLARIFMIKPTALIADEPRSMIDACSRTTIINALMDLKHRLSMTVVFITHDIRFANHLADRLIVLKRGEIVEQGERKEIFDHPQNEYTQTLIDSAPKTFFSKRVSKKP